LFNSNAIHVASIRLRTAGTTVQIVEMSATLTERSCELAKRVMPKAKLAIVAPRLKTRRAARQDLVRVCEMTT
jgi:superfamily II DNA/RNA helicase